MKVGYGTIAVDDAFYLYDTATNAVVGIDEPVAAIVDDYVRSGPGRVLRQSGRSPDEVRRAVAFLRACRRHGMLAPMRRLDYLSIADTAPLRRGYAQGLKRVTLGITERCNQRCRYCPFGGARRGKPRRTAMDWDTARRSIEYLLTRATGRPTVELFGGEPVLNWPVVHKIILHVREELRRHDVEIVLYTNATLLDRSKLELLMANRVVLRISLDGPARLHDDERVLPSGRGTHDRVLRVLRWIRRRDRLYYRTCVELHCTFGLERNLLQVFRYFDRPAFRDLSVTFGYRVGAFRISRVDRVRHAAQLDELVEQHLRTLRERRPFHRGLFSSILANDLGGLTLRTVGVAGKVPRLNGACLPGQTRFFVSPTGSFHPCENYDAAGSEIGDCRRGIDLHKAQALLRAHARLCNRMCQGCWAWRLCSLCFMHATGADGRPSRSRKAKACRNEKQRIVQSLRRYVHILRNEPAWAFRVKGTLRYLARHQDD